MNDQSFSENGHNGHGNGHANGNGHRKVFTLTPAQDELTFTILDTRRTVLADLRLSSSVKAFFAQLLDLSLNRNTNDRPGVVTISQPRLAETFGVSARTIFTWKRDLEEAGYIWMSKKFVPNMWPLDVYHVTAIDEPRRHEDKPTREGMWGNGNTRQAPSNPGNGARKPGQPSFRLPGSKSRPRHPDHKGENSPIISGAAGQELRAGAEKNIGSHPKKISGASRRKFRLSPEENFGSEPKETSGGSRRELRPSAEADCEHIEAQGKRNETSIGEGRTAPPVKAVKTGNKLPPLDSQLPSLISDQKAVLKAAPLSDPDLPALYERLRELEGYKYGAPRTAFGAFHKSKTVAPVPSEGVPLAAVPKETWERGIEQMKKELEALSR